ncbi:S8 family serine peptidase [Nocardia grenadensis]|uniref:S8 family serine peptidase n=1 Tax=Nocardia grenadensis TaxID=931537 RepID=UPI003D706380
MADPTEFGLLSSPTWTRTRRSSRARCSAGSASRHRAVAQDVLILASAANSTQQGRPGDLPAAFPGVITVGAVDSIGKRADFSQTGPFLSLEPPPTNELGLLPAVLCAGRRDLRVRAGVDLAAVPRGPASEVVPGAVIEVVPPAAAGKRG